MDVRQPPEKKNKTKEEKEDIAMLQIKAFFECYVAV